MIWSGMIRIDLGSIILLRDFDGGFILMVVLLDIWRVSDDI